MSKNKIGILGSGMVAQTLGAGFIKHGYEVMLGTRDAGKLKEWVAKTGDKAKIGTPAETAQFGDIIVLASKGSAAEAVVRGVASHLSGKTVIDTTNPIADAPPVDGVLKFSTDLNQSLMEKLQLIAPEAHLVKSFSCVGSLLMVNPNLPGGKPTMFIAGNDAGAKKDVSNILDQFGWETADMGKAAASRAIEPLCMLWCIPGFLQNDWVHALKMLRP